MTTPVPRSNWSAHVQTHIEYVDAENEATLLAIDRMAEILGENTGCCMDVVR